MEQKNLWIKNIKKRVENSTHYAELKTKKDGRTKEEYIDLIVGKKGKDRKSGGMHMGIKLNQIDHFINPREITTKIKREVISKNKGFLGKEEKIYKSDSDIMKNVFISFDLNGATGEITIKAFNLKDKENGKEKS
jgi:hypothetical protein